MAQEEESANSTESAEEQPFLRRGEDYESLYADNVHFYPSEWGLKLAFGELDQDSKGRNFVEQHTAISLPWLQAKLTHYFLSLQLAVYELSHGKIPVPPAVFPPTPTELPEGVDIDEYTKQVNEIIKKHYEQFVASL